MNRFMKRMSVLLMAGAALGMMSCNNSLSPEASFEAEESTRMLYTGTNGNVFATGMTKGNLTISYNAGSAKSFVRLFVSEGNGSGLVLANQDMTYSNGVYSYTLNHPAFRISTADLQCGCYPTEGHLLRLQFPSLQHQGRNQSEGKQLNNNCLLRFRFSTADLPDCRQVPKREYLFRG